MSTASIDLVMQDPSRLSQAEKLAWAEQVDVVLFAEKNFRHPDDQSQPFSFLAWQREAARLCQYSEKKGFMVKAPRGYCKTTLFCVYIAAMILMIPNTAVGYFSINEKAAKGCVRKIRYFIETSINPDHRKLLPKRSAKTEIRLKNGSKVDAYAQSEGMRGESFSIIVIDEWAQINADILRGAIRSTLRPQILIKEMGGSTPFGNGGDFYETWMDEENRDIYDKYNVQDYKRYDDYGNLTEFKSAAFMTKEEYLRRMRQFGPMHTAQELDGDFIGTGSNIIKRQYIENARDLAGKLLKPILPDNRVYIMGKNNVGSMNLESNVPKHKLLIHSICDKVVMGGDFGVHNDKTVFIIMGRTYIKHVKDRKDYKYVLTKEPVGRPRYCLFYIESWLNRTYRVLLKRIMHLVVAYKPDEVVFDGNGVGEGLMFQIQDGISKLVDRHRFDPPHIYKSQIGGKKRLGYIPNANISKFDLVTNCEVAFANGEIFIPYHNGGGPISSLEHEMKEFEYEALSFQFEWTDGGVSGRIGVKAGVQPAHDDRFLAFCYALLGSREREAYLDLDDDGMLISDDSTNLMDDRIDMFTPEDISEGYRSSENDTFDMEDGICFVVNYD
jgi:hypothetical protein